MGHQSTIIATYLAAICVKIMETLTQTLNTVRDWSIDRLHTVDPVADKNAIYKEFEEWIEYDGEDHDVFSLTYIGEGSDFDR